MSTEMIKPLKYRNTSIWCGIWTTHTIIQY